MNRREIAEQIFLAGIESVLPDKLISGAMSLKTNLLQIGNLEFDLDKIRHIYVIGAGKASAKMAEEVEKILGNRISDGHIIVKYGYSTGLRYIKVSEAGHPFPDSNGFKATEALLKIAIKAGSDDLVICLISGGGSSLLCDCPEGLTPDDLILVNKLLVNSGAGIREINAVRKHLSNVKGGRLAAAAFPASLVSLILSDVIGDNIDVIASGPTAPDPTTYINAIEVLEKFRLKSSLPARVTDYLYAGATCKKPETPKPDDPVFDKTLNIIIGSNTIALEHARKKAQEFNINGVIIEYELQGDTVSVSSYLINTALDFRSDKNEVKPVCILFGGETTVEMTGKGSGGRNQHLALLCAELLAGKPGITVLCGGTDGTDGPTKAAGAVVDSDTVITALAKNIDPRKYIAAFNSYNFFKKTSGHIITGPTLTNVMDIVIIIVD
jgi:hydroxypyruvate reductase/glycerate 2-kinase